MKKIFRRDVNKGVLVHAIYDIFDPNSLHKIYGERNVNGEIKSDFIDIKTLEFRDNFGYPIKVNDFNELIQLMKINKRPLNCLFSDYDDNTNVLSSGSVKLKPYKNKARFFRRKFRSFCRILGL